MPEVNCQERDESGADRVLQKASPEDQAYLTLCAVGEAFYMLASEYHKEIILNVVCLKCESRVPGVTKVAEDLMAEFWMENEDFGLKCPRGEKVKIERFS
jgi:hypothetical protein